MTQGSTKLIATVKQYFSELHRISASGGATSERASYPALSGLFRSIGSTLKPKVFCVQEVVDQGAGHPDFGLYPANQVQRRNPRQGQIPACGVVDVKPAGDDEWLTADSDQVSK